MQGLFILDFSHPSLPSYDIWDRVLSPVYLMFADWQAYSPVYPDMATSVTGNTVTCVLAVHCLS